MNGALSNISKLCSACKKSKECENKSDDIFSCLNKFPINEQETMILNLLQHIIEEEKDSEKLMELQILRSFVSSIFQSL